MNKKTKKRSRKKERTHKSASIISNRSNPHPLLDKNPPAPEYLRNMTWFKLVCPLYDFFRMCTNVSHSPRHSTNRFLLPLSNLTTKQNYQFRFRVHQVDSIHFYSTKSIQFIIFFYNKIIS